MFEDERCGVVQAVLGVTERAACTAVVPDLLSGDVP